MTNDHHNDEWRPIFKQMQSNYSPYILLRPLRWQVLRFIEGELHLEWYLICCEYHKITAGIDYHSSWMTHVIRARWSRHVVQERIENIGSNFVCLSKRWSFFVWHWHSINKYCVLKCSRLSLMSIKKIDKVLFFQKLLFYQCFTDDCTQNSYNASMEKGDFIEQQKKMSPPRWNPCADISSCSSSQPCSSSPQIASFTHSSKLRPKFIVETARPYCRDQCFKYIWKIFNNQRKAALIW